MPVAYQIYASTDFPRRDSFETEDQLSLLNDVEENIEVTSTRVAISSAHSVSGFIRYDVFHEFLVRLQYLGRARGREFREFVSPYKFRMFITESTSNGTFRPLLIRTKKKVASDFVTRVNNTIPGFTARPTVVDFASLRPRLTLIRGAWFGSMRQRNISATGVFGHQVDQSDEFRHAESIGELRNIIIELEIDGGTHTVMLSIDGGIVLYNVYENEGEELEIVCGIMSNLLQGCIAPVS